MATFAPCAQLVLIVKQNLVKIETVKIGPVLVVTLPKFYKVL